MRLVSRLLLIAISLVVFTIPVGAQDNTSFILGSATEVIFPQAIRFSITVIPIHSELSSATLVIQPEGGDEVTIDVDLDEVVVVREPYSQLDYIWQIPRNNPPHLFQEITFSWRVVTIRDEVSQMSDSFSFTDQRTAWVLQTDSARRFNLVIPSIGPSIDPAQIIPGDVLVPATPLSNTSAGPEATMDVDTFVPLGGSSALAPASGLTPGGPQSTSDAPDTLAIQQLLVRLAPVHDLLSANTGVRPTFNVIVYTDAFPPGCIQNAEGQPVAVAPASGFEIDCDPTLAGVIFRAGGYDVIQSNSSSLNRIQELLTEYLTRGFYESLWDDATAPGWFVEGLSILYTDDLKTVLYPPLLAATRNNSLFSSQLMAVEPSADDKTLWSAQSYGMVLYIAGQIGLPGLFDLARDVGDADSFAVAYQSALNKPVGSLLTDFRRWIFTDQASLAFGMTPYQSATFTPTPSRTPTVTPASSLTPTPIPTFTPTVTGILTTTPTATYTPSRTPTPAPPTLTPRPPGSLNTPIPASPQAVNPLDTFSTPTSLLRILTIGLVIIAVLALIFMRFRGK